MAAVAMANAYTAKSRSDSNQPRNSCEPKLANLLTVTLSPVQSIPTDADLLWDILPTPGLLISGSTVALGLKCGGSRVWGGEPKIGSP